MWQPWILQVRLGNQVLELVLMSHRSSSKVGDTNRRVRLTSRWELKLRLRWAFSEPLLKGLFLLRLLVFLLGLVLFNLGIIELPLLHDFKTLFFWHSQLLMILHHFCEILIQLSGIRLTVLFFFTFQLFQFDAICKSLVNSLELAVIV